jgi:hypothetical protein
LRFVFACSGIPNDNQQPQLRATRIDYPQPLVEVLVVKRCAPVRFVFILPVLALLAACGGTKPQVVEAQPELREVPAAFRGLIQSEVEFRNVQSTVVSGLGIVVGLAGTGGQPLNDSVAATMERELGLMGISSTNDALRGTALEGKTPRELLRDPNIAVVEVQAAVPTGAPNGTKFDVLVRALNANSLDGGTLWTTDLRIGPATTFGQVRSRRLAVARGPVFVNPFASAEVAAAATQGRVLAGGEIVESLGIVLSLNTASHGRARSIVSAINSRFPQGRGDRGPTARGRTGSSIELIVPTAHRAQPQEFLQVLQHVQIDQVAPELYARKYVQTMREQPELADTMSFALEALGERALPVMREMYDFAEQRPRLAALRAGAKLNDPRVAAPLLDLATKGRGTARLAAIVNLSYVDAGPQIETTLRNLLSEDDLAVRIAAYESLARRAEKARFVYLSQLQEQNREVTGRLYSPYQLEQLARENLPGGSLQGVTRRAMYGKFLLDEVQLALPEGLDRTNPSSTRQPLIYVTQQGIPRIVLFGGDLSVNVPSIVSLWDNRFALAAGGTNGQLRIRYLPVGSSRPVLLECKPTLPHLIDALASEEPSTPGATSGATGAGSQGLNLSYSQVVAVLSALQEQGATRAAFSTESDRLNAAVAAAGEGKGLIARPDNPDEAAKLLVRPSVDQAARQAGQDGPRIVPIDAPPAK